MKDIRNFQFSISNFQFQILGLFLVILIHIFLLSRLIFFPYPELFVYPYLTNHGMLPYQQILDQHFPGLLFLPVNFGVLGLSNAFDARLWQYGLVAATQVLLFFIAAKVLKSTTKALLVSVLYLAWQPFLQGWMLWINNLLPVLYLAAFYFAYEALDRSKHLQRTIFLTGLTFGLVLVFKQVALPVAALTFFLMFFLHRSFKSWSMYCTGLMLPVLGMLSWVIGIGVLPDFWFWTVQFNVTTYAKMAGKSPTIGELVRLIIVYLPVLPMFLKFTNWKLITLLSIFIFGGMFGGGHRFDLTYFQPSLPFICIASVIGLENIWKMFGRPGLLVTGGYTLLSLVLLVQFYRHNLGAYIYYFDKDTLGVVSEVKTLTKPGEEIFVFGATPLLYQLTETMPAGRLFVFQFPWFLFESENRIYQGLVASNPHIIVSDPSTVTDNKQITNFAPQIYQYIQSNYHLRSKIGTIEILERN